jgi:hypothetical protein
MSVSCTKKLCMPAEHARVLELMKAKFVVLLVLVLSGATLHSAPHKAWTLASEVFAGTKPAASDHSPKAMVETAEAFLASLSPEERAQALLPVTDPERRKWTNVPSRADDGGIRLGDLSKPQLEKACAFLSTVMSTSGYLKCRNIMMADDLLLKSEEQAKRRGGFGAANFWIAIFGTPSETALWGVQWDGHHVAVNLTIHGESMSMSPTFIGTQPHTFTLGGEKIVPMEQETALVYEFINSLDDQQRAEAVQGDKRGRMKAGPGKDGVKPALRGLSCKTLTAPQRQHLMKLIGLWVHDLPGAPAEARLEEIATQLDQTHFAWHGPYKPGSDASYHLNGPGVIIEYSGQDLGGDPLDHLHSIYRDPTNEYGAKWAQK